MMSRRQMLMMLTEDRGLPAEYLQVEYLESTGTQYLSLFPNGYDNSVVDYLAVYLDLSITGKDTGSETGVFGGKPDGSTPAPDLFLPSTSSTQISMWCNSGTTWTSSFEVTFGQRCTIDAYWYMNSTRKLVFNDQEATASNKNNSVINSNPLSRRLCLFKDGTRATSAGNTFFAKMKVYSAKVDIDGTIQRDLVPCIRISDSKPGMYDLVGRQFYTNAGTGEFLTDYTIILPDNPTETGAGFFTTASFPLLNQQKITLKYFGVGNRTSNVFFDGYTARTSPNQLVYTKNLTANDGEYNLTATRDGTLYIGISRNGTVGSTSAFYIKSILLKIE